MDTRLPFIRFIIFVVLLAGVLGGLIWLNIHLVGQLPVDSDFTIQWNAAREWVVEEINPYDPQVAENTVKLINANGGKPSGEIADYEFVHPLYAMLFYAPFGPLDFSSARALWMTFQELCLIGIGWFGIKITGLKISSPGILFILLFSLLGYFGIRGVVDGNFGIVQGFIICVALYLLQKKQDLDAGLLLAVSSCLPSMSFLVILYAILWGFLSGRRNLAIGVLGGMAFLTVLSMVFIVNWPQAWIGQVMTLLRNQNETGSALSSITSSFPGIRKPITIIFYSISGIYLFLEWLLSMRKNGQYFGWMVLVTLSVTFFISPRGSEAYFVCVIPAFFLLFRTLKERWGKAGEQAGWVVLLGIFFATWGMARLQWITPPENGMILVITPLLSLSCLWWSRWWTLHRPRVWAEEYLS